MNTKLQEMTAMFAQTLADTLVEYMEEHSRKMYNEGVVLGREIEREAIRLMLQEPMSIDQAAESIGCCPNTVNNLIERGELEAFRVGSGRKIQPKAILEYKLKSRIVP